MAKTLLQLQTSLAYRMDENTVPQPTTALFIKRTSFFNEAYRDVMRRHTWWFSEASTTFDSVAAQASYTTVDGVPADLRSILELRFQDKLYSPITQNEGMGSMSTPYSNFSESYFVFAGSIYFVPPIGTAVTDGISLKYYKTHTELTTTASTIIIPDIFSDVLVAYAYGRSIANEGERGSAGDGFAEYTEILKIMTEEQNKYLFSFKSGSNGLVGEYS